MSWNVSFYGAGIILLGGILWSYYLREAGKKRKRILNSFHILLAAVFLSGVFLFLPIYGEIFAGEPLGVFKTVLLSVHNTIRLFLVDGEFSIITDYLEPSDGWIFTPYSVLAAVLFVLAPMLTFGAVLSLFKNISAYRRYLLGYFREAYIFSELSEKSLALARSIRQHGRKRLIVFTDVFESNEEGPYELAEQARELGAVCFKKDIQVVNFKVHSKRAGLFFFAIGEDETENMDQTLKLISQYRARENTHLYVFSARTDSELLLTSVDKGKIRVRRVNEIRSLINRILYDQGGRIFENAEPAEDGEKEISAVILGMGQYGTYMAKALCWFCQMDGYRIRIDAFDRDPLAEDKFAAECPELLSREHNGVRKEGDAQYEIQIHSGILLETGQFARELGKIGKASYVFVALGSDEENIKASVYLRMLCERSGVHPTIQAIVYNSNICKALREIKNYRGQPYGIDFMGDLESSYSEKVILDSELEAEALKRHLKWGSEEEFWNYEYNYRSSMATAIHMKARRLCKIPGAGKRQEELTREEQAALERLEHKRWNAYMRSEGYIYSGSPEKSSRNDLGKLHYDLTDFTDLMEEEKRKDSSVGSL